MRRFLTSEKGFFVIIITGVAIIVWAVNVAVDKGYLTLEGLEDLVPQIEYKNGEQIQTIDGKRFIACPNAMVPTTSHPSTDDHRPH